MSRLKYITVRISINKKCVYKLAFSVSTPREGTKNSSQTMANAANMYTNPKSYFDITPTNILISLLLTPIFPLPHRVDKKKLKSFKTTKNTVVSKTD